MTQKEFSKYIFDYLERSFPEFIAKISFLEDGSFECSYKNPSGIFSIWIATYNCEITFGLESPDGKSDIHTHISCYEIDDIESCTTQLFQLINEIFDNKTILYRNESNTYDWADLTKVMAKEKLRGVNYQKYLWNENK